MLTYLYIDGFKSFCEFEMYFSPFTVIAGTNASGKSNLFDAITLLSSLAKGMPVHAALQDWRGDEREVFTLFKGIDGGENRSNKITLVAEMLVDKEQKDQWGQDSTLNCTRLRYELALESGEGYDDAEITHESLLPVYKQDDIWGGHYGIYTDHKWLVSKNRSQRKAFLSYDKYDNRANDNINTAFVYEASGKRREIKTSKPSLTLLSRFDNIDYPHLFAARQEMADWHYMQLNPSDLRRPSDAKTGSVLTSTGGSLPSAVQAMKRDYPYAVQDMGRMINKFLPNYVAVDVVSDEDNRKLVLTLKDRNGLTFSSRVLSEGTLRIIALCALSVNPDFNGVLCFEEPENGIHPFRLKAMAALMSNFATDFNDFGQRLRQVIVNSHSPLFVELAKKLGGRNARFYLSRMVTHIAGKGAERRRVGATRIVPVLGKGERPIGDISDSELKQTSVSAADFLKFMAQPNWEEE